MANAKSQNQQSNTSSLGFETMLSATGGELQFMLPDGLRGLPISPTDTVAQASSPASPGSVPLPGSTPIGTTGQPAAGTAALREESALPNVAEIIGKFGGADQLRKPL